MSWAAIVAWFHTVPDVIWSGVTGALIASGISYFSTRATNKSSDARLKKQLKHEIKRTRLQVEFDREETRLQRVHDADQNDEDRKAAIRREVYLVAIEKAHALLAHLGGVLDQGLQDGAPFQDFLQSNAKVWLVADLEAAHLSRELTTLFGEVYLKTVPKVFEFARLSAPYKARQLRIDGLLSERDRLAAEWQRARPDNIEDIKASHAAASSAVDALLDEQQHAGAALHKARVDHMAYMFDDMREVQQTLVKLVSALRKELHLAPDEEGFLAQLREMESRARASVDAALKSKDRSDAKDGGLPE